MKLDDLLADGRAILKRTLGGKVHIFATQHLRWQTRSGARARIGSSVINGQSFCRKLHEWAMDQVVTREAFNRNPCGLCAMGFMKYAENAKSDDAAPA